MLEDEQDVSEQSIVLLDEFSGQSPVQNEHLPVFEHVQFELELHATFLTTILRPSPGMFINVYYYSEYEVCYMNILSIISDASL